LAFNALLEPRDSISNLIFPSPQRREQKWITLDVIGGKDKHRQRGSPFHFAGARENPGGAGANNLIGMNYAAERFYQFALAGGMLDGEEGDGDIACLAASSAARSVETSVDCPTPARSILSLL
jgi:hypothetical protein